MISTFAMLASPIDPDPPVEQQRGPGGGPIVYQKVNFSDLSKSVKR
jgi:hypothetical protein